MPFEYYIQFNFSFWQFRFVFQLTNRNSPTEFFDRRRIVWSILMLPISVAIYTERKIFRLLSTSRARKKKTKHETMRSAWKHRSQRLTLTPDTRTTKLNVINCVCHLYKYNCFGDDSIVPRIIKNTFLRVYFKRVESFSWIFHDELEGTQHFGWPQKCDVMHNQSSGLCGGLTDPK